MRSLSLAVALTAVMAWAVAVTTDSYTGSSAIPSGSVGVVVTPATQKTLAVRVDAASLNAVTLLGWCYSGGTWGRLPSFDLTLTSRVATPPTFLTGPPLPVPPNCSRVYWQTESIRPSGTSHTIEVSLTTEPAESACDSLIIRAESCGTSPATVPSSRTAGSTNLEITNSPENAGSPKVKCIVNPSDGGVGFGATNPGLVRSPGESMYFGLDSTHTVICVCDTPATAITTTECVP